jgi:hypothetical protein
LCGDGLIDFIHRPKSKILKILKNIFKISNVFNNFNILPFGRWMKFINPSPHSIIQHRQNLLELKSLALELSVCWYYAIGTAM